MTDESPLWTLERLEATISELPLEPLLARYRQSVEGGHVWRPLDSTAIGIRGAEWCGWCLRVRVGHTFEGWLSTRAQRL